MDETANVEPIDIKTMIQQAPDLFTASEQFLLIEPYLEKALKP
jgi:hypothetical protein